MDSSALPTAAGSLRQMAVWILRHPLPTATALCVMGGLWVVEGWHDYRHPAARVVARVRYPEPVGLRPPPPLPSPAAVFPAAIVPTPTPAPEPTPDEGGAIFSLGGE